MPTYTSFKGVTEIGRPLASDNLEANVLSFFQWGFLGVGGFTNVNIPGSGVYGGDHSRLRPVEVDPNDVYDAGQLWESARKDWVYEQDVEYAIQPIDISGVNVNGHFYPIDTTGVYKHHIDYPNGRIVFDSAIPVRSVVQVEYSHRYVSITTADAPWFRRFQVDSYRVDSRDFGQSGSGAWAIDSENRIQLPAIVVEVVPNAQKKGKELGSLVAETKQDVLLHVFAETRWDFKQIHDTITYQWQKTFLMFDKNTMYEQNDFPLDANGSRVSGAKMYPDLVAPSGDGGHYWKEAYFSNMRSSNSPNFVSPLHFATIRATVDFDSP